MTIGGIASLIAALAFAVLVVFLCINLAKLSKVLTDVQETVKRLNTTIDIITKDVDNLSIEVEGLLNKGNTLVDDVNQKISKTDPLFTAIGDVGLTVSDLTDSANEFALNLLSTHSKKKRSTIDRIKKINQTYSTIKNRPSRTAKAEDFSQEVVDTRSDEVKVNDTLEKTRQAEYNIKKEQEEATQTLKQFINTEPSTTAGEIRIK